MKKRIFFIIIYVLAFATVVVNGIFTLKETVAPSFNGLPCGQLIESIENSYNHSILNVYLVESSLGSGIRGEIQRGDEKETIFWQTGTDTAECSWFNKKTVVINSVYLNVERGDTFDSRRDVSILQTDGLARDDAELAKNE